MNIKFIVIDLFCGAGGVTAGFLRALIGQQPVAIVAACINHDRGAIKSHALNHPGVQHFREDIRTFDLCALVALVDKYRRNYPDAKLILWASLECTNYSRAKGGKPRNADSRSLPEVLHKVYQPATGQYIPGDSYLQRLQPDYILIENVAEFMAWGPLDSEGRPLSVKNGECWLRWREEICALGYRDQWRQLNAANYGAHTHRTRLFGIFARPGLPIVFPDATHAQKPVNNGLFGSIQQWRTVREVLQLDNKGQSIFTRTKPLAEKTLLRVLFGLRKTIARKETAFLSLYYSNGGNYAPLSQPSPVVPTKDRISLVSIIYRGQSEPAAATISPQDSPATIQIKKLMRQHGIADILMRLLLVEELLAIQGFPPTYCLSGPQTAQKKFIGNAVVPVIVQRWTEALATAGEDHPKLNAA